MTFLQKSSSYPDLLGLELSTRISQEFSTCTENIEEILKKCTEDEEKKLVFSYEHLTHFPIPNLLEQYGISDVELLDLSHNRLRNLDFLVHFPKLTTLIMDHNLLISDVKFPTCMKSVTTFWVNYNQIDKLHPFIPRVNKAFPNLKYLSLMGNIGCPSYLTGGTYYQYLRYRLFVISQLKHLECLDDLHVTLDQKQEAHRLFSRSYLNTLINLPFPQYLNDVQQRVKLYLRQKSNPSEDLTSANGYRRMSLESRESSSGSSNRTGDLVV